MADVDVGASAPVVNAPAADAVPTPDVPTGQENVDGLKTDESVPSPKTYTEEETRKLVNERLTKERRRLERTLRAELRAEAAERQLQEMRQPQQQPQQPKGRPRQEDFANRPFDEYLDAVTDWKLEQRELKRREETQRETAQQRQSRDAEAQAREVHEKLIAVGQQKFRDFDEVVMADDVPISPAMVTAAARLKNGAEALYHLCSNVEEVARIARLHPVDQVWELKDFAAKLSAPPRPTNTPPPIVPNNSQAKGTKDWKDMGTAEHVQAWLKRPKR